MPSTASTDVSPKLKYATSTNHTPLSRSTMSFHVASLRRPTQKALGRRYATFRPIPVAARTTATAGGHAASAREHSITESNATFILRFHGKGQDAVRFETRYKDTWTAKRIHLSQRERQGEFAKEQLGPLSAEAADLVRTFQSGGDPFEALRLHLTHAQVDIDVLRVCICAAGRQIFKMARKERLAHYEDMDFKLAKAVLGKIWEDPNLWLPLVRADFDASWYLCWFVTAEKLDGFILDWIKIDAPQARDVSRGLDSTKNSSAWRSSLLRMIVEVLIHQGGNSADRAIICFLDFCKWKQESQNRVLLLDGDPMWSWKDDIRSMSIHPALIVIVANLKSGFQWKTDAFLWDRLISFRSTFVKPTDDPWDIKGTLQLGFDVANLRLFHPSEPSAEALLQLMPQMIVRSAEHNRATIERTHLLPTLQKAMLRAHVVTSARQQHAETASISQTYLELFKKPIDYQDLPPQLRTLPPHFKSKFRKHQRLEER